MTGPRNSIVMIAADGVGAISATLGGLLTITPVAAGRWLGLQGTDLRYRRMLGTVDLLLGIAILAGRSSHWRWRGVAVRAWLHLVFASEYARGDRPRNAVAMLALFVVDSGIACVLRGERRSIEAVSSRDRRTNHACG